MCRLVSSMMARALFWSFQKPGVVAMASSSVRRRVRFATSKITSHFLDALAQRLNSLRQFLEHCAFLLRAIQAIAAAAAMPHGSANSASPNRVYSVSGIASPGR